MRCLNVAFVLLCACASVSTTDVSDMGVACVEEGRVTVDFQTCLSSSCDSLEASCVAVLEGEVLVVTSEATVSSAGRVCTADCGLASTTCELPEGWEAATGISYAGETAGLEEPCASW